MANAAASVEGTGRGPWWRPRSGRNELVLLVLGFLALAAVAATAAWQIKRAADLNEQIFKALAFKADLGRLLSLVQDAETGQRGYLLTRAERYLRPYEAATQDIERALQSVLRQAVEREVLPERRERMEAAVRVKMAELAETVALQRNGQTAEALAVVETERGRNAMNDLRATIALMLQRQDEMLGKRVEAANLNAHVLLVMMVLGLAIAGALAWAAQAVLRRQQSTLESAQEALEQANVGLEAAVTERTADLIAANTEIQRFAYIVSHDLRAPLVNVMGFTSELDAARRVLKEQIDGLDEVAAAKVSKDARLAIEEDLPEAIGFIRTSTAKMDRLINAILRLSREGNRVISPEQVSVEDMVKSISDTIYQQTQAADAEIEVRPGLPPIVTDRMSIEQILQNLIENAVKYLDRSRPGRIVVSGRRLGPQVEYAIEDNGRGIDAKDHERVFELFRRAGAQDQPGEGLGLAFVRASVRRLGGAIRMTSEPGRGTTFHLTFPAVYRAPSESRPA